MIHPKKFKECLEALQGKYNAHSLIGPFGSGRSSTVQEICKQTGRQVFNWDPFKILLKKLASELLAYQDHFCLIVDQEYEESHVVVDMFLASKRDQKIVFITSSAVPKTKVIKFNPVAPSIMQKALGLKPPFSSDIESIVQCGDIVNARIHLDFLRLVKSSRGGWFGRDESLVIFHSLGKVIHKTEKLTMNRLSELCSINPSTFNNLLYFNGLKLLSDIEEMEQVINDLSICDVIDSKYWTSKEMQNYGAIIPSFSFAIRKERLKSKFEPIRGGRAERCEKLEWKPIPRIFH